MLVIISWQPLKNFSLQDACLDQGGKWATNGGFCIYKNCAENGSCKSSYINSVMCESLPLGISKDELFFNLGMPQSSIGNIYTFSGGGTENEIKVTIIENSVVSLQCKT